MEHSNQQKITISNSDTSKINKLLFDNVPDTAREDAIFSIEQRDNKLTIHIGGKRETLVWILTYCLLQKNVGNWLLGFFLESVEKMNNIPIARKSKWTQELETK